MKRRVWMTESEDLATYLTDQGELSAIYSIRDLPELLRGLADHEVIVLCEPGREVAVLAIVRDSKHEKIEIWAAGEFPVRSPRFVSTVELLSLPGAEPVKVTRVRKVHKTSTWAPPNTSSKRRQK